MAKSLRSFPESQRFEVALRRLKNSTGLSKLGAQDYFAATKKDTKQLLRLLRKGAA